MRRAQYISIPYTFLQNTELSLVQILVLSYINGFCVNGGSCTASNATMASIINVEPRTIERAISKLRKLKLIKASYVNKGGNNTLRTCRIVPTLGSRGTDTRGSRVPTLASTNNNNNNYLSDVNEHTSTFKEVSVVQSAYFQELYNSKSYILSNIGIKRDTYGTLSYVATGEPVPFDIRKEGDDV